jgi:hypothetical protein
VTEEISLDEYRRLRAKRHKYGARAIVEGGYRFDSQAEAERYAELQLLLRGGEIADLVLQPSYVLQEAFRDREGRRVAAIRYVADFAYTELSSDRQVVEDVKGVQTPVFKLKAKLFRFRYPQFDYRVLDVR